MAGKLTLRALDGSEAMTKLVEAVEEASDPATRYNFKVHTTVGDNHISIGNATAHEIKTNPSLQKLRELCSQWEYVQCTTVSFANQQNPTNPVVQYVTNDGFSAEIEIKPHQWDFERLPALLTALKSRFNFITAADLIENRVPEDMKLALKYYERSLEDLKNAAASMHSKAGEIEMTQADHFRKRSQEMDHELGVLRAKLQAAFDERSKSLDTRESGLNEKIKSLDLQEHTAKRRELARVYREALIKRETITVSESTGGQRRPVHKICIGTLIFLAMIIATWVVTMIVGPSPTSSLSWELPWLLLGSTVLFSATLLFYLRFNYLWFDRLAQAELSFKKTATDFDRAEWLSELVLDYGKAANSQFPNQLVVRFSENLFRDMTWGNQNVHPAEDLVDLVRAFSTIEAGKDGVKLQMRSDEKLKKMG